MAQVNCTNLGQRHPRVMQAIRDATERYGYVFETLATDLRSKANEMALIVARLFTGRPNIITREHSYHGWTARTPDQATAPTTP